MKKEHIKGQVALFIIIGIIIIAIILLLIIKSYDLGNINSQSYLKEKYYDINNNIDSCLNQESINAIRIIGFQGGYIQFLNESLKTDISNIAYGYYLGKNTLISENNVEREISNYLALTSSLCIPDNITQINITYEKAKANTNINKDYVNINIKIPFTIIKDNNTIHSNEVYNINIPVRLGEIYETADKIIEKQKQTKGYIPLSYISKFKQDVIYINVDENNLFYIISDNKSKINNVSYSFMFGVKLK